MCQVRECDKDPIKAGLCQDCYDWLAEFWDKLNEWNAIFHWDDDPDEIVWACDMPFARFKWIKEMWVAMTFHYPNDVIWNAFEVWDNNNANT